MKETNFLEKFATSFLNTIVPFAIFFLVLPFPTAYFNKKLIFIATFFCWNLLYFIAEKDKRFYGMNILGTFWKESYSTQRELIYLLFYTLSFSTLLFYVYAPTDLFFFNMLCIQLPMVLLTKTTLHGWLCGVVTVKPIKNTR